jgi:hypothetical protein
MRLEIFLQGGVCRKKTYSLKYISSVREPAVLITFDRPFHLTGFSDESTIYIPLLTAVY